MANLNSSIDGLLNKMHSTRDTGKGTIGEKAVFKICEEFYQKKGGILVHSYSYKVDKEQAGNIKRADDGHHYVENLGDSTEIDILYVSKYRVFPIEVKAYKAKNIVFTDEAISGCYITNKSPVHQNEMHCRHLYAHIFRALPNGRTDYIVPIVCMVDNAAIEDRRSDWQKEYIKVCILNNLSATIEAYNTPMDYQLNLAGIDKVLKEEMISSEMYLPPRL